ncbi:hypothetical protein Droror1_Dr00010706 [Drosera rotundifolia]
MRLAVADADEDKYRVLSFIDSPESEERLQSPAAPLTPRRRCCDKQEEIVATEMETKKDDSKEGKWKLIGPVEIENGADTPPVSKKVGKRKVIELAEIEHGSGAPSVSKETAAGGESKKQSLSPTVFLRRKKFNASPPEEDLLQLKDDENMDSSNCTTPPAPNDQVIEKLYSFGLEVLFNDPNVFKNFFLDGGLIHGASASEFRA